MHRLAYCNRREYFLHIAIEEHFFVLSELKGVIIINTLKKDLQYNSLFTNI